VFHPGYDPTPITVRPPIPIKKPPVIVTKKVGPKSIKQQIDEALRRARARLAEGEIDEFDDLD
jgi:hypothetical protein